MMRTLVGKLARILATTALGVVLAFFVAVSAFADGEQGERLITIGIILAAYAVIGLGLGVRASPRYGLGLALPGLLALAFYAATGEARWWYLIYAALCVALAAGGAAIGARLGQRPAADTAALPSA